MCRSDLFGLIVSLFTLNVMESADLLLNEWTKHGWRIRDSVIYTLAHQSVSQSKVKIAQVKVKPEYSNMNYNNYRL